MQYWVTLPVFQPQVSYLASEGVSLEQEQPAVARALKWQVSLTDCSIIS